MGLTEIGQYFLPQTAAEVVELLGRFRDRALVLGGGTFLHGLAARGVLPSMEALIDLQKVGLSFAKVSSGALSVGAMTTFSTLAAVDAVARKPEFGALNDALQCPPAQIRNMATVGGCVASASPLFDLPVALMALDASVMALGPAGYREIGLHKFFLDYFEHALERTEFLTEIRVPAFPPRSASAFLKLETNANDLALLNVAVRVTVDESGICREARVVVGGGVGKVPVRAVSCEDVVKGQHPDRRLLSEAGDVVALDVHPVSDHRGSAKYRTAIAKVYVRRAFEQALARLKIEVR